MQRENEMTVGSKHRLGEKKGLQKRDMLNTSSSVVVEAVEKKYLELYCQE